MEILSSIWFGAVIGTSIGMLIQHWLNRSMIVAERNYTFQKEELFKLETIAEWLIEKLHLLEDHRIRITEYYSLMYQVSQKEWSKFIDLTESLDKGSLEIDQWKIISQIFLYFPELGHKWNECLELMKRIFEMRVIMQQKMNDWVGIIWRDEWIKLDKMNEKLWDKPLELCEEIRRILNEKREIVKKQKPLFFIY